MALPTSAVLLWKTIGLSATLYVNGVRADGLRDFLLEDVDVRIDADGDIHITAPGYKVEAVPEASEGPLPESELPSELYWLVTMDEGSRGYVADVLVNGSLVRKIRSGEEQLILDVGPYLRSGENKLMLLPSEGAGQGTLRVYLGTGTNEAGTVVMDDLSVDLALTSSGGKSPAAQTSTFTVP